ncbi:MAG: carbohydrate kinase family protein [Clostridia bacterium]|nr:carbohydrate kinase family protein [Clostridia bacterium]
MGKSVLVIGSTCVDVIIRIDHLPRTEENLHPKGQQVRMGGCAYNVANIVGRGGADTVFVTPVGLQGLFGPYLLPTLQSQPWCRPVVLKDVENGCCYCLVEASGERTFISVHGTEYTFSSDWMIPYENKRFDYTYVCGFEIEEESGEALSAWLEKSVSGTLMYAPGPHGAGIPRERTERLFRLRPILHLNEAEAMHMGEDDALLKAMRNLHRQTQNAVIVTLGPDGAMVLDGQEEPLHLPALPVPRVADTIGAGDAHAGAVLLALSRGRKLPDAVAFANRVAAQVVAQAGATLEDDQILFS